MLKLVRKYQKVGIYAFILPLAAASLLIIANSPVVASQLNEWKLLPQPERFTELYFTDHTQLPTTYTPGQPQSIAFTVHNLEHKTTSYKYVITQHNETDENFAELATGTFTLAHDQSKAISQDVTLLNLGRRTSVRVTLTSHQQTIQYWVVDSSQPSNITKEGSE